MNRYSHILMGELIYEYTRKVHGIQLDKESFIKGCVIPDFSYYAVAHPHFMKFSLGYIQAEIEALSKTHLKSAFVGSNYSYRVGIICHYFADFFCFAHSKGYKQVVVNHLKYEHLLYEYFMESFDEIAQLKYASYDDISASADEINDRLLSFHSQYSEAAPSYSNDLSFALKACAGTVISLVRCSCLQTAYMSLQNFAEAAAV